MLGKIKLALRISHNRLDSDIEETMKVARAEMIRSGISAEKANSDDYLINKAIKTYCLAEFSNNDKMSERYYKSWEYQIDNLRKSSSYNESGESDV